MPCSLIKPALFTGICTRMLSLSNQAASFDCTKAKAADEIAICANRNLHDQDVTMALLYDLNKHFMAMGGRASGLAQAAAQVRVTGELPE